ncbi:TonB-dependent receptor [Lysobacter capsici]|uniref:TonB-dependent receptor n=1 Tax=Lysobacter capsici TaxID=435897 RepID=UPI00398D4B85
MEGDRRPAWRLRVHRLALRLHGQQVALGFGLHLRIVPDRPHVAQPRRGRRARRRLRLPRSLRRLRRRAGAELGRHRRPAAADLAQLRLPAGHRQHPVRRKHRQLQHRRPAVRAAVRRSARRVRSGIPQGQDRRYAAAGFDQQQPAGPDLGGATRGTDSVKEIYGEIEVPLLSGLKGAEELVLNASARYTDYKSYGGDHTYKIGGLWTPVSWLTFRASYGTSYRAPALFEQFLGGTSGFIASGNDPCSDLAANDPSIALLANCAAEGLAPGYLSTNSVKVITAGGAEQGLKAETSKNFTTGIILQPEFSKSFGDLSFAVDYYKIEVENGVSRAGGGEILQRCYNDPEFRTGGGFCRLVDARTPGTNALTVHDSYVNLATDRVRGLDFTVRYVRDIGPGTLRSTLQATHFLEQSSKLFAEDELDDYNGNVGSPSYTATLDTTYEWKKWKVRYGLEWVDATQSYGFYGVDRATAPYKMHTEDYFLSHLSTQYKWDKWSVTGGVRNLFGADPKVISHSGAYNRVGNAPLYSGYDYVGRTFFMNVQADF